jgi:hypothetical protein
LAACAAAWLSTCGCAAQQQFPELKVAPYIFAVGNWIRAEDVLVGDVSDIRSLGVQQIEQAPDPLPRDLHEIYWCQADFHADAVIKGKLPAAKKKLVWGVIRPDCTVESRGFGYFGGEPRTRVWFLREEGDYLRPSVDVGGVLFVAFKYKWEKIPALSAPRVFASVLLDPAALGLRRTHRERLFEVIDISRSILEPAEFISRMQAVAAHFPDTDLNRSICGYLESEFNQGCR